MSVFEKVELIVLAVFFTAFLLLRNFLPVPSTLATLILSLSALLLLQGLIRDLAYLACRKKQTNSGEPQTMFGLCVESSIGILGIIVGAILMFFVGNMALGLSVWIWAFLVFSILVFGFLIKDYVFDLSTMKIHKDVEHMNIIVSRKKA